MLDVGIDLVSISRFHGKDEDFAKCFLTSLELECFGKLKERASKDKFLASRWACKEAIFKATQDMGFIGYSVLNDPQGKPYVVGHPEMKISISHDGNTAIAIVIVEKF